MDKLLNAEENEVVRLTQFFKKQAERLKAENRLGEEYVQLLQTCDALIEQMYLHARNREEVLSQREQLKQLVKDNALCPKCGKNTHLKLAGTDKSIQGWVSNKYRCRRCNIEFVWNAPNNPWDMMAYVEHVIQELEQRIQAAREDDPAKKQNEEGLG
ncbi:MAG TPA: hypothetical protein VNZ86_05045, partial [Bacteroidia bacterium]|nr:hypothetical protein [Bacteroidia bacterium]